MTIALVSPPAPAGTMVMRTYSGGFGDMMALPPGTSEPDLLLPPLELAQLAAGLRSAGAEPRLFDLQANPEREGELYALLDAGAVDGLVTEVSMPSLERDVALSRALGERGRARLFVRTAIPDEAIRRDIVRRSGAQGLLGAAGPRTIARLLGGPGASLFDGPEHVEDVDTLPLPARDLLDNPRYRFDCPGFLDAPVTSIHTSYGCPFSCAYYCPYPLTEGTRVRFHSLERVLAELEAARALGIRNFVFRDPTFTIRRARTLELCREIVARGLEIRWLAETRVDLLDDELLGAMAAAGCRRIEVGVESVSPQTSARAKQGLGIERVDEVRALAHGHGIDLYMLLLFGLPWDDARGIAQTLGYLGRQRLTSDAYNISVITPYPGTPLHADAVRNGWILDSARTLTGYDIVMRTDALSADDLAEALGFAARLDEGVRATAGADPAATEQLERLLADIEAWGARPQEAA